MRLSLRTSALIACGALALGGSGLGGCCPTPYHVLAARYADDQVAASRRLAPMGGIAFRLCRQQAAYDFIVRAEKNPMVSPPPWVSFYGEVGEKTGPNTPMASLEDITWSQSCDEARKAVQVVHTVCRGLREHGRALALLANGNGSSIDTGALKQSIGEVASLTGGGSTSGVGKAAVSLANTFAQGANAFVAMVRAHELGEVVVAEQNCMDATFDDLMKMHDALVERLADVQARRVMATRVAATSPVPERALSLLEALDAVGEADQAQRDTLAALDTYKLAITRMQSAHAALARAADSKNTAKAADVESALNDLESSVLDLTDLER